jgi:hypothetical protein
MPWKPYISLGEYGKLSSELEETSLKDSYIIQKKRMNFNIENEFFMKFSSEME